MIIAIGDQAEQNLEFYTDMSHNPEGEAVREPEPETCWAVIREGAKEVDVQDGPVDNCEKENDNDSIKNALEEVSFEKLKENDLQFNTGVQKFIDQYNRTKSDAVLASAFHNFGKFNTGNLLV